MTVLALAAAPLPMSTWRTQTTSLLTEALVVGVGIAAVTAHHVALIRASVASVTAPVVLVTFIAEMAVTELDPHQTTTDTIALQIAPAEMTTVPVVATENVVTVVPPAATAATHTVADVLLVIDPLRARELLNPPTTSVIAAQFSSNNSLPDYVPRNWRLSLPRSVPSRKLRSSKIVSVAAARALVTLNSKRKNRFKRHLAWLVRSFLVSPSSYNSQKLRKTARLV
jgi:hypothetical protein